MLMKLFKIYLVALVLIFSFSVISQPAQAWSLMDGPSSQCRENGACELNDLCEYLPKFML